MEDDICCATSISMRVMLKGDPFVLSFRGQRDVQAFFQGRLIASLRRRERLSTPPKI